MSRNSWETALNPRLLPFLSSECDGLWLRSPFCFTKLDDDINIRDLEDAIFAKEGQFKACLARHEFHEAFKIMLPSFRLPTLVTLNGRLSREDYNRILRTFLCGHLSWSEVNLWRKAAASPAFKPQLIMTESEKEYLNSLDSSVFVYTISFGHKHPVLWSRIPEAVKTWQRCHNQPNMTFMQEAVAREDILAVVQTRAYENVCIIL